jgi:trehalose 6-phosphate phosphatase
MSNALPSLPADLSKVAILLDVDGTILDIAPTPQSVLVPSALRDVLSELRHRTRGALAFVSGRPIDELDRIFAPLRLPAVGGHGAEVRLRGETTADRQRVPPLDAAIKDKLAGIAEAGPGILVEDKDYSVALHYRLAPEMKQLVHEAARRICEGRPDLLLLPGKYMLEIKPAGFDKASAVRDLMRHPPFAGRTPVFIGDDVTDHGVFAIMPELGGIPISVGHKLPGVVFHLERPADVRNWLEILAQSEFAAS